MIEIPQWLLYIGAGVAGLAYLATRLKYGTNKAESEALGLAKQTVDFLKDKVAVLESQQKENTDQIHQLRADNERLTVENQRLTDLVMGNEVPTALQEFLTQMHVDTQERIAAAEANMVKALGSMTQAFSSDLREALARMHDTWDGETERRQG